jgi:O-antigen/teichoic acid export membrane protein
MGVFNAVLMSLDRFDVITGVVICGAITRAILVVTFLNLGYGLIALALITLLTSSVEYSAMAVMAKVLYPPLKPGWALIDFARCKELFGFGIYRFIWIVANQVIFYTDSVVLGIFLNVGMITYYAIAGSLINYGRNIVSLAIDTFYPTATKLDAKNDIRGLQELQILGTRIGLLVGLPLCIGFMLLGEQFITLWMGKAYAITATVLIVLTIPQFTSMSQYISALILVGMAKHKVLAYIAAAEGAANLSLSIFLVRKIGLIGVAWGTAIPHAITTAIVIPLYTLHALGMSPWEYFSKSFIRPVISAVPIVGLCYVFSISIPNPSWLVFAAEGATVGGTYLALSYFICLTREQQAAVRAKVRRLVRREEVTSKPVGTYGH